MYVQIYTHTPIIRGCGALSPHYDMLLRAVLQEGHLLRKESDAFRSLQVSKHGHVSQMSDNSLDVMCASACMYVRTYVCMRALVCI